MTKRIKFEGQIHSFPDDATDDEINDTLGGSSAPSQNLFDKVKSELSGAVHMPLGRSLKNIGQGAIDLGEFATNPAGPAMKYLAQKDIPLLSKIAQHWPQYPESDVFGLGEGQPGDTIFQAAAPIGPAIKGAQLIGKPLAKSLVDVLSHTPKVAEKAGDLLPITKGIASRPYKKQMQILEEKNLLGGYKPNVSDVLESERILKSKGMKIPHEAVNEAVAKTLEGDYSPWFNLQSTVRREARRLSRMGGVHKTLGDKLHALAEKMHTEIGEAQASRGAPEAERLMHQGKERTARYHKISPTAKVVGGITMAAHTPKWISQMVRALSK